MKKIKINYHYLGLCSVFMILCLFFIETRYDWHQIDTFNMISSLLFFIISKFAVIRVFIYSLISLWLFILMNNIVNKKNMSLFYLGLFLFLLVDHDIFTLVYTSHYGFSSIFFGIPFILLIINYISKDTLYKLRSPLVFIMGLIAGLICRIISLFLILFVGIKLIKDVRNKDYDMNLVHLYTGLILASTLMLSVASLKEVNYKIPNILNNLKDVIIPNIYNISPIIVIITMVFLIYFGIISFKKNTLKQEEFTILSLGSIILYFITVIFSHNNLLNLIIYIFFLLGSSYILKNVNRSVVFKRRIDLYYLSKIIYIITLMFVPNITPAHIFLIAIIDILIVLELMNYTFPVDYLKWLLCISVLIIFSFNIYIFSSTQNKVKEMNFYIKNNLECGRNSVILPLRFDAKRMKYYVPVSGEERKSYTKFYNINFHNDYIINFEK